MKAAVVREHGGPDHLNYETGFPDPKPGEGDVIVAVKASSLNYHDVFTRRGMPGIKVPMPAIMGLDVAGEIAELGAGVSGWDGFYRTGDVFRRDANGFFFFLGRADDMFVCGGENIWPGEVEKMLEKHPGIHQAAVIPVPDELKGHKPIAFVVRNGNAALDEQAVKEFALANAPAYQHPRRVIFIDEMPLAGANKIDKRALARDRSQQERLSPESRSRPR